MKRSNVSYDRVDAHDMVALRIERLARSDVRIERMPVRASPMRYQNRVVTARIARSMGRIPHPHMVKGRAALKCELRNYAHAFLHCHPLEVIRTKGLP